MPSLTSIPEKDNEIARFTVTIGSISGTTRVWYQDGSQGAIHGDYEFGGGMTVSRLRYNITQAELRFNKTSGPAFSPWATSGVLDSLAYTTDLSSVPDSAPIKNAILFAEFVDGTVWEIPFEGNTHSGSGFFTIRLTEPGAQTHAQGRQVGNVVAFVIAGVEVPMSNASIWTRVYSTPQHFPTLSRTLPAIRNPVPKLN